MDVGDGGILVKYIPLSDSVCCVATGCLEDCLWVSMCREDRSEQSIGFFWTRRSPSERSEEVFVYDGAVEVGFLKVCERILCMFAGRWVIYFPSLFRDIIAVLVCPRLSAHRFVEEQGKDDATDEGAEFHVLGGHNG